MRVNFLNLDAIAATPWEDARGMLRDELERLKSTINTTWDVSHHVDGTQRAASRGELLGQLTGTLAEQPTGLSVNNDGLIFFVSDYGHLVRWNGSSGVWQFAPGDNGAGYFQDFAITPQAAGWALCDGSSVTYLVVGGAALATASITLPNLTGTAAYRKSAAAYAGIVAASGTTGTGVTGTGTTGGQSNDHTHNFSVTSGPPSLSTDRAVGGSGAIVPTVAHTHDSAGTTGGTNSDHSHSVPSLSVPALGVGSIDMAHLSVLPYFRR